MYNIEKIQKIIDLFKYDKDFQFWKIKTRIFAIIDNFYRKYMLISLEERHNNLVIINRQKLSQLICNGYNVNPCSKNDEWVSKSAMRQYIDILQAFQIIKPIENCKNCFEIIDSKLLNNDLEYDSINLGDRITNNFLSNDKYIKKIFYSILITYLVSFNENETDTLNVPTHVNDYALSIYEIKEYAKSCGYEYYANDIKKFGTSLDEVYENLFNQLNKKK